MNALKFDVGNIFAEYLDRSGFDTGLHFLHMNLELTID